MFVNALAAATHETPYAHKLAANFHFLLMAVFIIDDAPQRRRLKQNEIIYQFIGTANFHTC